MLTIHHLGKSQSERIVWLCEELGLPYELKRYERDAVTRLAPPELKLVHPLGNAPILTEGRLVLAESAAIIDYIIGKHGGGRLALGPTHADYSAYLYWFHFANGNLQPNMGRNMLLNRLQLPANDPTLLITQGRLTRALDLVEARLGEADYLAGTEFTAADIMTVFSLTTMRIFIPLDLTPFRHIRAYLSRIGAREGYQRAMLKGDPDLAPMLT
ncbi:glutathione S-transferase family protein [Roseateles sp. GG27B]